MVRAFGLLLQGQGEEEGAPHPRLALYPYLPPHQLHELLADREPKPRPAVAAGGGGVGLGEGAEQASSLLLGHPYAGV